ncbi:MAG: UMP kinase [Chlorobi bacterium]|nr:UMP kinase [Chlorobiota bacterium]
MKDYQRILIKISGEALGGEAGSGLDEKAVAPLADAIVRLTRSGKQVAIVVGAGNFFRGVKGSAGTIGRVDADYMGMLGTVMNAIALKNFLVARGNDARVMSALKVEKITEALYPVQAVRYLEQGKVVIFAGGTGNPYFTTDTAGVLRAIEIDADLMLKATKVDGVYTADPEKDPSAVKYDQLTYDEALEKNLAVMDGTAFALARENGLPIIVFNMRDPENLTRLLLRGESLGTLVH